MNFVEYFIHYVFILIIFQYAHTQEPFIEILIPALQFTYFNTKILSNDVLLLQQHCMKHCANYITRSQITTVSTYSFINTSPYALCVVIELTIENESKLGIWVYFGLSICRSFCRLVSRNTEHSSPAPQLWLVYSPESRAAPLLEQL